MNKTKLVVTADEIRAFIDYDPQTGAVTRRKAFRNLPVGSPIGSVSSRNYLQITYKRATFMLHRLAWLHHYGQMPTLYIDHINGNTLDNRIANLREVTQAENMQNAKMHSDNKSGYMGVYWHRGAKRWRAAIALNQKITFLGLFDTPEEASAAYLSAKKRLHSTQPTPRV